jgi:RHS repeat-associated protein
LTDINGLLTDAYAYEAFGEIIKQLGNTQNSYLFAGEQRDPNLGLDYLRARYLDVNSGRFVSRDLIIGDLQTPITLHKHLYANANPVNYTDPSGLFYSLVSSSAFSSLSFSIALPSFTAILASTSVRLFAAGLLSVELAIVLANNLAAQAQLEKEWDELLAKIAAITAAATCGIPLFHYTDRSGMLEIVATGTIWASPLYKGGGFTHPVGAYATTIPPVGPSTRSQLRNLYKGGNAAFVASHFVMMCSNQNPFYPTGYSSEWVAPAPYPGFPVPVVISLNGPNLMLP